MKDSGEEQAENLVKKSEEKKDHYYVFSVWIKAHFSLPSSGRPRISWHFSPPKGSPATQIGILHGQHDIWMSWKTRLRLETRPQAQDW